ncbi:hypothetical protein MACK_000421 [Theileria orientalis]|uniref:Uncharacterized protein n=1 Tax=Theileria orientalis TaxID=68886 RepID=A0A976QTY9_THEOR|nr:hypothetical protein MACK_000421 [Theileria orientalis]
MSLSTRIDIYTYQTGEYKGITNVPIKVTAEKHWDKLSKAFKKHTHTIQYLESGTYVSSKYNIRVSGPIASGSKYYYDRPTKKVEAVEVYFWTNDNVNNKEPLIVGFFHENIGSSSSKSYYCWSVLKTRGSTGSISGVESISEKDLINGLLEELGRTSMPSRQNKLVIRLERPDGPGGLQYPGSGHYLGKITVKKLTDTRALTGLTGYDEYNGNDGFDGYEHTVDTGAGSVDGFYVSYENNSMYIVTGSGSWLGSWSWLGYGGLKTVTAYFDNTTTTVGCGTTTSGDRNSKRLVLIVFSFKGIYGRHDGSDSITYVYPYSYFINDARDLRGGSNWFTTAKTRGDDTKIYYRRDNIDGTKWVDATGNTEELLPILRAESKRLKQIEFVMVGDSSSSDKIKQEEKYLEGQDYVFKVNKFQKVVMEPNTVKDGPWYVYNNDLFTGYERGKKIEGESLLGSIVTSSSGNKYHSITVYYSPECSSSDGCDTSIKHMALLVEFDDYGKKTYIKRENEKGTKWAITTADSIGIGIGDDKALLPKLQQQREKMRPLIAFVKGSPGGNKNISKKEVEIEGQVKGKEGYKFKKVVMTANTSDEDGPGERGSSVGPWRVLSTKLITLGSDMKIQPETVLDSFYTTGINSSSSNKYESITVYYTSNNQALLIEFDPGGRGTKKYIKRVKQGVGGTSWESVPGIGISTGGEVTADDLAEIAKDANIVVASSNVISSRVGSGTGANNAGLESWLGRGLGLGLGLGPRVVSWLGRGPRSRSRFVPRLGSSVGKGLVSRVGNLGLVPRLPLRLKGHDSPASNTTSLGGNSYSSSREAGAAGPVVGHSSVSQGDSVEGPGVPRVEAAGPDSESNASTTTISSSDPRGVEGGGSSSAESQVNHSPTSTSRAGSQEVGRGDNSDGSSGRGGNGGGSSDGSDATIGGAVGGGVSLIVASGGTGFGIYRYRHVFLSLIGK